MNKIIETEFFESGDVFRTLFEHSPNAILIVDIHDSAGWVIVQCNETSWKMYGYDRKGSLRHQPLTILNAEPQDFAAIIADAHESGITVRDELHRKQDGIAFQVRCVYTLVSIKGIEYITIFVQDMTDFGRLRAMEEKYQAIIENSPDGMVIITPQEATENSWPWIIEDCNKEFCQMNGFDRSELIGKDIRIVSYETPFEDKQQAKSLDIREQKWPVIGNEAYRHQYYQKIKQGRIRKKEIHRRKDGTIFIIEASTRLVSLGNKEYVLGIDRDITEEEELRRYLDDLQIDVGRTFHTFSSTLFQMQLALTPTIKALGPDPFKAGSAPTASETWQAVVGPWNILVTSLRKLLTKMKGDTLRDTLSSLDWGDLDNLLSQLLAVEHIDKVEFRVPVLQLISRKVVDVMNKIQEQHRIRKESIREVKRDAEKLEHMACLVILHRVQDRVVETDWLVRDIRQRVLTGSKTEEEVGIYEFWSLVEEAVKSLAEYATYKGITFREDDRSNRACVKVGKYHLVRALNNLLDNAIKYSWWRDANVKPWIGLKCYTTKEDRVYIEIEDFGVPIPQGELDQDLIYQLGYRGRLSGQRSRPGTGIGLYDSRTIARRYGGDVMLKSRPASPIEPSDELEVPHIKMATLYLPIYKH